MYYNDIKIKEVYEKTGDDNKYYCALKYLFNINCNSCMHKGCPYCVLKIVQSNFINDLKLIINKKYWDKFKNENNFGPTKKLILILQNDSCFMNLLNDL